MKNRRWIFFTVVLLAAPLSHAEQTTNFLAKLEPVPPFSNAQAAAKARSIPVRGIDQPAETNGLSPGDSVTTLVTLHEKHHRLTQWLICFQAFADAKASSSNQPPPMVLYTSTGNKFEFAHLRTMLHVRTIGPFAEPGSRRTQPMLKDKSARIPVNATFLSLGLDKATAAIRRLDDLRRQKTGTKGDRFSISSRPFNASQINEGRKAAAVLQITPEEERALAGSYPALFSYFSTIQQTPELESIMFKVLSLPSLWSIVKNFGISPGFAVGQPRERVGPLSLPDWDLPSHPPLYALPIEITLNKQPALTLTMIVAAPRPPLLVCGGIVGFLAENPEDKENYLTLRVISAHSSTGLPQKRKKPARDGPGN